MSDYQVPLRDIRFVRNEVWSFPALYARLPGCADATLDVVDAMLEELAKFSMEQLVPLYRVGDEKGCQYHNGEVTTPPGFREAYAQFVAMGWPALASNTAYGGQGLPKSMGVLLNEVLGQANWAWAMYPGLSHGARHTLEAHGTEAQKKNYLTKLIAGTWTGTMCLTEPQAGSDVGLVKTRAEPQADGTYKITGTKIFISAGEHDMAENIVHIVLARLPDAPVGTKGISVFIVPKFLPDAHGNCGARNAVICGGIEHKMGIHGNATCVMNFDGATGFMIGEPKGLKYMFTFMNDARVGVALQGLAHAERGFQGALGYARSRLQMRATSGVKNPQGPADLIIEHPDVRRMLLTCKAFSEGHRLLLHYVAMLGDIEAYATDAQEVKHASDVLALLTPIAKAFMTETGFECANHGMQVLGGHGYIADWGLEQNVRDARISTLYEGTTGIQALDLLGRKVLGSGGELLRVFIADMRTFCNAPDQPEALRRYTTLLNERVDEWEKLTADIGAVVMANLDEVGAASVEYLMFSGYVTLGYMWCRAVEVSLRQQQAAPQDADFYTAKLQTADFYFQRLLPRTLSLAAVVRSGASSLMAMNAARF